MGTGYTRNDTGNNIADGNVINASDLDGEFDAVESAFNGSTGHSHDGTTGEGPQIDTAGIADDAVTGAKIDSTTTVTAASFVGPLTGNVTGNVTGTVSGNAGTATKLATARSIGLSGDVSGSASFDGSANISITATVADDSHNHVVGNIDGIAEYIQDTAGAMFSGNTESGITVTYQDGDGTIDLNVNDPTITLNGDVSGSATMTNLGNVTITTTVADDSHNHTIANVDGLQSALDGKQASDADLTAIGALAKTNGNFIVGNGSTWVAESGSTARASLGLGSLATSNTTLGNLATSNTTLGNLATSNTTLGNLASANTVNAATITDNSVGAAELNVSGNGTSGQALTSDGDGSFSWADAGGGTVNDIQTFTSSGTYTVPTGATSLFVYCIGGGGGSGDTYYTNIVGGAGGGGIIACLDATNIGSTVSVTIGAGGNAGNSNNAGNGGTTTFGNYVTANGGGRGGSWAENMNSTGGNGTTNTNRGYRAAQGGNSSVSNSSASSNSSELGGGAGGTRRVNSWYHQFTASNGGLIISGGTGGGYGHNDNNGNGYVYAYNRGFGGGGGANNSNSNNYPGRGASGVCMIMAV
jgi:hypothetical protein